jgi:hypothetical protein
MSLNNVRKFLRKPLYAIVLCVIGLKSSLLVPASLATWLFVVGWLSSDSLAHKICGGFHLWMLSFSAAWMRCVVYNILDKLSDDDIIRVFHVLLMDNLGLILWAFSSSFTSSSLITAMKRNVGARRSPLDLNSLGLIKLKRSRGHGRFPH